MKMPIPRKGWGGGPAMAKQEKTIKGCQGAKKRKSTLIRAKGGKRRKQWGKKNLSGEKHQP